jgi:hypothetical protein
MHGAVISIAHGATHSLSHKLEPEGQRTTLRSPEQEGKSILRWCRKFGQEARLSPT